jgi:hypothetical protein
MKVAAEYRAFAVIAVPAAALVGTIVYSVSTTGPVLADYPLQRLIREYPPSRPESKQDN